MKNVEVEGKMMEKLHLCISGRNKWIWIFPQGSANAIY
jgi:hypothetical protein